MELNLVKDLSTSTKISLKRCFPNEDYFKVNTLTNSYTLSYNGTWLTIALDAILKNTTITRLKIGLALSFGLIAKFLDIIKNNAATLESFTTVRLSNKTYNEDFLNKIYKQLLCCTTLFKIKSHRPFDSSPEMSNLLKLQTLTELDIQLYISEQATELVDLIKESSIKKLILHVDDEYFYVYLQNLKDLANNPKLDEISVFTYDFERITDECYEIINYIPGCSVKKFTITGVGFFTIDGIVKHIVKHAGSFDKSRISRINQLNPNQEVSLFYKEFTRNNQDVLKIY